MKEKKKYFVELPQFTGRNVPITEIAKVMGKDAQYIRIGLQQGVLEFGYAIKMENSSEYNYYCSDRQVWESIGYFKKEEVPDVNETYAEEEKGGKVIGWRLKKISNNVYKAVNQ